MKKNILISTIFRNSESKLSRYHFQIKNLVENFSEYNFFLSIYENDSSDNTKSILKNLDWKFLTDFSVISEDIGTNFYGSIPDEQRVKNLAAARNKTLEAKNFLKNSDYVLSIESDIKFDLNCADQILNFQEKNKLKNVDIVSAVSYRRDKKGTMKHYDLWATRRTPDEEFGKIYKNIDYEKYYSTFNCFCLYTAQPIKQGIRFGWYNTRINRFDCDTVVICEEFHKINRKDIYINHLASCYHE